MLEIGSGSGRLAAIMGRLVGPAGKVGGIELIPYLAERSRMDLERLGIGNVEIVTGDGARGHAAGAPYDRAIITAATWHLSAMLFDQVTDGGRILLPVELRDGSGCEVTVLRRQGAMLVAEHMVPGWFVPLLGAGQGRGEAYRPLESLQFWSKVCGEPSTRHSLPLGALPGGGPLPVATQFRAFLGRTESGMALFAPWADAELNGGRAAAVRMARAFARWAALGLPGMGAFGLEIHRVETAPASSDQRWIEPRGATALAWRLKLGAASWQYLLGSGDHRPDPCREA